jgi:4-diphosphocytidyl-2-C-methyl-D-erythritol kinase
MAPTDPSLELRVAAPAKVNLGLEVLGLRPDGYHEIRTVMQAVSLCDDLTFRLRRDGRVTLRIEPDAAYGAGAQGAAALPASGDNLVVRAARLLAARLPARRTGCALGADVVLRKRIPIGGGLGGGSSDAAAALNALNALWGLRLAPGELEALAAELGSDVPFFVRGGTALCEGRGERVTPLQSRATLHYVLISPGVAVSTADVYRSLASCLTSRSARGRIDWIVSSLAAGEPQALGEKLFNVLQGPALRLTPDLRRLWRTLQCMAGRSGCLAHLMSGSGSTIFGLCGSLDQPVAVAARLADRLRLSVTAVHSLPPWWTGLTP